MLSGNKWRIVRDMCTGRAGSSSREPCYLIPAGTGEGISTRVHAAKSQGDKTRGVAEVIEDTAQIRSGALRERCESCVNLVASIVVAGARIGGGCVSRSGGVNDSMKR